MPQYIDMSCPSVIFDAFPVYIIFDILVNAK